MKSTASSTAPAGRGPNPGDAFRRQFLRASAGILTLGVVLFLALANHALQIRDTAQAQMREQIDGYVRLAAQRLTAPAALTGTAQDRPTARARAAELLDPVADAAALVSYDLFFVDVHPQANAPAAQGGATLHRRTLPDQVLPQLQRTIVQGASDVIAVDLPATDSAPASQSMLFCTALPDLDSLLCASGDLAGIRDRFASSLGHAALLALILTGCGILAVFVVYGDACRRIESIRASSATLQRQNEACCLSALRYRTIFDLSGEAIAVTSGNRVTLANPATARLLGISERQVLEEGLLAAVHPDDTLYVSRILSMRQRGEPTPQRIVFRLHDSGKGIRWVQCTTSDIPWEDALATLTVLTDVTECKSAGMASELREQLFANIIEQTPYAVAILTEEGKVLQASTAWRLLQRDFGRDTHDTYTVLNDPFVVQAGIIEDVRTALGGTPLDSPPHPMAPAQGGSRRWFRLRLFPVRDASGKMLRIVSVHLDATVDMLAEKRQEATVAELAQTNADLAAERSHLHAVLESLPWATVAVDDSSRVTLLNSCAAQLAGISVHDAMGMSPEALPEVFSCHAPMLRRTLLTGEAQSAVRNELLLDGRMRTFEATTYPVATPERAAVLRVEDVTARVVLEDMMVQSEKMVSVGALAAGVAHEINNPLGAILQGVQNLRRRLTADLPANLSAAERAGLSMEVLRNYIEDRQIPMLLEGIREAGERAGRIVSHMLTFSRRSEGLHRPALLTPIIDKALELAETDYNLIKAYDFRQIEILRDEDPDLPPVKCSASELEQVILNLLKNAAHALSTRRQDAAPPRIRITTRREENAIRLEIADNGPGMNAEERRRAFEPFFTTKDIGVGTGLGLSICYFIITTKHRGTIRIDPAPEGGASFIIRLPL